MSKRLFSMSAYDEIIMYNLFLEIDNALGWFSKSCFCPSFISVSEKVKKGMNNRFGNDL